MEESNRIDTNDKFESMFINSLKCINFDPYEVGLKMDSFFIGMTIRNI
jgi:hypothetical protein